MNKLYCFVAIIMFINFSHYSWGQTSTTYWTGEGGRGKTVTVSEPIGTGLSAQEQALLPLIQSTIIASFQRFSAMTVFDRQNLENILREQRLSLSGDFSEEQYIRIGNLTNARLIVFGKITKISNNFMLELAVTDVETGERIASYPPRQVSLLALENLSAIREASADLLGQLGINLTTTGSQELRRVEGTARVQAENSLARGIAAQRQGTVVEALSYYFEAASFDPSLREAVNRVSVISANISSGNLGQDVRTRLQIHDNWRTIVTTASNFYANHLPYEFIYDTNIKRGTIDFERRTTGLSIGISLIPTDAWRTINDLRQGLRNARQQNETWNFSLNQIEPRQITVTIRILNENNKVLSTESYTFSNLSERERMNATLTFRNVRAEDITDLLRVEVVNINGKPARSAGETGFIQITILSDYDSRVASELAARRQREAAELAARRQREAAEAEAARRQQEERNANARKQQKERKATEWKAEWEAKKSFRNSLEMGFVYFQWENGVAEHFTVGFLPLIWGIYWSPIPYTTIGLENRFGMGNKMGENADGEALLNVDLGISPLLGLVFPIGNIQFFSDAILEINLPTEWRGLITDFITPGFDVGLSFLFPKGYRLTLKYRGIWYKDCYTHTIATGLGFGI